MKNGTANPVFPCDAFVEVPVRMERDALIPQTVPAPEAWMLERMCVHPRHTFGRWLAGGKRELFMESMMATADLFELDVLLEAARWWRRAARC